MTDITISREDGPTKRRYVKVQYVKHPEWAGVMQG